MAAVKALQQWCKIQCEGYRDVAITNMTTSFRDGLAFCALIHKHRPDLIDFDSLSKENVYENNHLAFRMAEQELGIPALLDAEDMVALKVPDRLSILTYVSQYYNYFHGRSPIGGMAGIKRPAEESNDEQPGKKNQPVTAKVLGPPKADTENKRDVLVERSNKTGSVSSNCNVCNKHVHLVQRHLVDGKLYHRNCFKCSECSNILLSGTYKPGKGPNTFICKIHTSTQKAPSSQAPQTTLPSRSSKAAPAIKITTLAPTDQNSPPAVAKSPSPYKPSPLWQPGKMESSSTPTPAPRSNPLTARSEVFSVTPKSTSDNKKPTDTPKAPSGTVLKNQEARQRFFESAVSPGSNVSVTKSSATSPAVEFTVAKPFSAGGSGAGGSLGKGRVVLRPSDWSKDKEKEKEKENQKEKDKAKSVISKLVVEESNKSSSPSWKNVNTTSNVSPLDTGTKGPSGKTRLIPKAEDLEETPTSSKTPGWLRNKDKDLKPASTPQTSSKEAETAPADWRSRLKPVAKSGTPKSPTLTNTPSKTPDAGSRPASSGSGSSQSSGPAPSSPSPVQTVSKSSERPWSSGTAISDSETGSRTLPADSSSAQKANKVKPGHIPKEEIMRELREIEMNLNELEKNGVELEKQLRNSEEEGEEDTLMNDLMVDWFNLIRNKQVYVRRESELVYHDLEEEQPTVEAELRKLMEKPDHLKTPQDSRREKELMAKLVEIVNDRNAIVDGLDEDRLREEEEDEQLNKMMQNLDVKKEKKKQSPITKLFRRMSKREPAES